jgi:hypothetical protein
VVSPLSKWLESTGRAVRMSEVMAAEAEFREGQRKARALAASKASASRAAASDAGRAMVRLLVTGGPLAGQVFIGMVQNIPAAMLARDGADPEVTREIISGAVLADRHWFRLGSGVPHMWGVRIDALPSKAMTKPY